MKHRALRSIVGTTVLALAATGCSVDKKRPEVTAPEARVEFLRLTLTGEAGYPIPFARAVGGLGQTHTLF